MGWFLCLRSCCFHGNIKGQPFQGRTPSRGNKRFSHHLGCEVITMERRKKKREKREDIRMINRSLILIDDPFLLQTLTRGPGTSRQRSAPFGRTSRSSTAAATTRTGTATLRRWTTACRVCWASAWSCPRTSTTATRCGWSGRSSPSPSNGRGFCRARDRPRGPGEDSSWRVNGGDSWKRRVSKSHEKKL